MGKGCSGQLRPVGLSRERNMMAKQLGNKRDAPGGLMGAGGGAGVGSFSQLSPLACLCIQPGPMFRDTNDTERLGTAERGR